VAVRPPRTVTESRASVVRLTVPTDANFMGHVFGGVILSEVDRVAYIAATRHSGKTCVTASFDRVDFVAPVRLGEVVEFDACLTYVGRTSMEVWVQIRAEDIEGGPRRTVGNAFVTMVAIDKAGQPTEVPGLLTTTETERTRFREGGARAKERRKARLAKNPPAGSPMA
jgi:acyl-CoA hydrolase